MENLNFFLKSTFYNCSNSELKKSFKKMNGPDFNCSPRTNQHPRRRRGVQFLTKIKSKKENNFPHYQCISNFSLNPELVTNSYQVKPAFLFQPNIPVFDSVGEISGVGLVHPASVKDKRFTPLWETGFCPTHTVFSFCGVFHK